MRRAAWLVTLMMALVLVLPAGRAAAQETVPDPDFNGDGFGDLAVGAPGEDVGSTAGAGAVSIVANPGSSPDEALLYQGKPGVAGTAESGDAFGWAVAANDYNDAAGQDSLAMGAPGEDVGAVADAGAVVVLYSPGFFGADGLRVLTQDRPEAGDRFGSALADGFLAGSDGTVDLAVGAPGDRVGNAAGAGAVSVIKNDDLGFLSTGSQLFYQGAAGVSGTAEAGDGFGTAVAVGGFGEDAGGLAVGAPGEDVGSVADAGTLTVLYGLDGASTELLTQGDAAGAVEAGDRFGAALSEPLFHENDVLEDLGVGAPGQTVGGRVAAGAGSVLFGAVSGGLGGGGSQFFHQGVSGLGGTAETRDTFGAALGAELG